MILVLEHEVQDINNKLSLLRSSAQVHVDRVVYGIAPIPLWAGGTIRGHINRRFRIEEHRHSGTGASDDDNDKGKGVVVEGAAIWIDQCLQLHPVTYYDIAFRVERKA